MSHDQLQFILEKLHFSADLPEELRMQLASVSDVRQFATREAIFRQGVTNSNLYLVRTGSIALEMRVSGRGFVRILTVGPGEVFGWSSLINKGKMTTSAIVVNDAEIISIPAPRLREICSSNSEFGFLLMRQMANAISKRLVATRMQLLDLFSNTPAESMNYTQDGSNRNHVQ